MGGGAAVAHPPVPAALSRLRSDESKSTVDSPMSTSSAGPSVQAAPPRPATHLPPASGGADGPAGDSSDEEGAHRPPSPERPPPAPAAPPAPPFAPPTMQLAQGLRPFSAAPLPAAAAAPRTTRVSDEDRKELHRARVEAQAAAEKERAETEAHVRGVLVDPDTSIYDILMVEFVLQPDIPHEAGAMRALYLKQLKDARDFDSVPRQRGVANMTTLRDVVTASPQLREMAVITISTRKVLYAESQCGHGTLGSVEARPDETLMALMTRTHAQLQPKMGRPSKESEGGTLKIRQSRERGQVTLDWRERE